MDINTILHQKQQQALTQKKRVSEYHNKNSDSLSYQNSNQNYKKQQSLSNLIPQSNLDELEKQESDVNYKEQHQQLLAMQKVLQKYQSQPQKKAGGQNQQTKNISLKQMNQQESDNQIPILYQKLKQTGKSTLSNYNTQKSKSPNPALYQKSGTATPTAMSEIRMSHQYPLVFMNNLESQQINQRNPQVPGSLINFKSQHLPHESQYNSLKEKKKSTSSNSGGTFTLNINTALIKSKQTTQSQLQTKERQSSQHKKSNSLYNKKLVEIMSGLQQSLGVIASNAQNNFIQQEAKNKQKSVIESAKLTSKISQMNNGLEKEEKSKHKRKNSKTGSIGPSGRTSMNPKKNKNDFKTIEDTHNYKSNPNRQSIDVSSNTSKGIITKGIHQRTKSDFQQPRKQVVTLLPQSHPQQIIHHYHTKKNTLLVNSSSSIDNFSYKKSQGDMTSEENQYHYKNYQPPGYMPSSVKHQLKINQAIQKQQSVSQATSHLRKKSQATTSSLIENATLGDLVIATKNYHTNVHTSGNASIIGGATQANNTIEYAQKIIPIKKAPGERVSDAKFIASKKNELMINSSLSQNENEKKLRSTASSPSLHQQLPIKKHKIKQNNVFDFGPQTIQNPTVKNTQSSNQSKVETSKKKTLISKDCKENKQGHKRSTSDGSSLTKMFHFKQQMLINKIFSQTNNNSSQGQQQPNHQKQQSKVQVISSLSSKRLSNEENQENIMINISPRLQQKNLIVQQNKNSDNKSKKPLQPQLFLQQFKHQVKLSQPMQQIQQNHQQKQMLIQAIQNNNQAGSRTQSNGLVIIPDSISSGGFSTHSGKLSVGNQKQQSNLKVKTLSIDNSNNEQINKRQSQQIMKSKNPQGTIGHHKRAKSDANKQILLQNKQQQTNIFSGSGTNQKLFFLNLNKNNNNQQIDNKALQIQNHSNNFLYPTHNIVYSARQSPQNSKSIYYNFEDTHKPNQVLQQSASLLPTARSDKSQKLGVLSNQTTQRKQGQDMRQMVVSDTPQFNYLSNDTKQKLVYQDNQADQKVVPSSMYQTNAILQSQQFNKLTSMFYGLSDNQSKLDKQAQNTIYSNIDESDVYQLGHDDYTAMNHKINLEIESGTIESTNKLTMHSGNQSPKLNIIPTPKIAQPGCKQMLFQDGLKNGNMIQFQRSPLSNFIMAPSPNQPHHPKETFEDLHPLQTFDSIQTTHQNQNLTPRSSQRHKLIKQIKVSFNKLKQPIKTNGDFYRFGKMLGKGAFGRVNLAIHKLCEQLVAVKSINKQFLTEDESSKKKLMQEVHILQRTRHQNIVRLYDTFESNKQIIFVMELCAGGDLLNYVRKRRKLSEQVAKYAIKGACQGLEYCHGKGIVHRDIKLDNLLLDESGIVKLCDFGVSRQLLSSSDLMTEQCGTPAYIAPEILKDKGYRGFQCDVWSLGVCLYAMLYGTVPFKANNMSELHQLIMKAKYSLKDDKAEVSEDGKALIRALLEPDPNKRITLQQLKNHKWMQEAYEDNFKVEIFTQQEKDQIKKDFTYQDMARYKRNQNNQQQHCNKQDQQADNEVLVTEEHLFTEHALDSTQNALLKNCSTKSVVLAPFNSTMSHIECETDNPDESVHPPLDIDMNLMLDKRVIKFAARVKDINRQYEMNNNCELDNGVYNKFIKQSTENANESLQGTSSVANNEQGYAPPLCSQNSDEEIEAELIKKNRESIKNQQLQTFLNINSKQTKDTDLLIDYEVVEKVETYGYPRQFVIDSIENYEMNDAATCYFLIDKERQFIDESNGEHFMLSLTRNFDH